MNEWHKSSYSPSTSTCVEVREHQSGADVRDTEHREAGHLPFPAGEWAALLASVTRR
ncbi:DUF397 domain-containing protein [Nocardiopsis sp. EMB25]|uniref:DUF397 domain-containing protein n=1 Tax=Nocardiopsis TaxID=2013 RepID=UPI000A06ACF1|nr:MULTISPECIES: DUF397 domain-containing protein [Nocardiopsis]MCY9785940.1 DUF397 domain-containing protein [Nocardiopsis sp. EMB25]